MNAIIAGEKTLSDRMSSRNLFFQKLFKSFERHRATFYYETNLIKQLDVFDYMADQDNVCNSIPHTHTYIHTPFLHCAKTIPVCNASVH